jgi:O-antigen/teichoic acid export membrane protein
VNVIKRNLGWLLISQAATWGMSVLLLLVAPRKLGDHAFGQLSFAMVYVSFFELVALFGTGTFLMKEVARDASSMGRYVVNTVVMKLLLAGALISIALGLGMAFGFTRDMLLLITAYCIGMLFNALNNGLAGGLLGMERMGRPAMWDVARSYVGGVAGIVVLMTGGSLLTYALAFNLACAIPFVANGIHLWPELRKHWTIDLGIWRAVMVGGIPFFVWSALLVVYGTIDIPLLEGFSGSETVGWYALAYRWVSMPVFFAASVATAFFPALSASGVKLTESFSRMANRALQIVVFVATPAAVGIAMTADTFLHLLYGTEFQQAVPLMRILALHIPIVGVDIILGSVVVAADRQRQWVLVGLAAAVFNPLVNLAAIPLTQNLFDNGAIGAAVVTVVTEAILLAGAIRLRPEGVLDRATTRSLGKMMLASLAMVPVVLALHPYAIGYQVAAGALTYALASFALGTISVHDVASLVGPALRRRRPPSGVTPWPPPSPDARRV